MDQGVIQNFRTHYSKRIILRQMKAIDVMRLMQKVWEMVQPRTIAICFRHANFQCPDSSNDVTETNSRTDDDPEDDIPLARLAQLGLSTATVQDYMTIDDNLPTSERHTDNDITNDISSSKSTESQDADDNENIDADRRDTELPTSLSEAMDACAKLQNYFEQCEHSDDFLISLERMANVLMKQDFKKDVAIRH